MLENSYIAYLSEMWLSIWKLFNQNGEQNFIEYDSLINQTKYIIFHLKK